MSKLVLIEYTANHTAAVGRGDEDGMASTIESGTIRQVDERSAKSLVKKGKAKLVSPKAAEKVLDKPADTRVEGAS